MRSSLTMKGAEPIGPDDIAAAERRLGFALPPSLVALCLHQNGGKPDRGWLITPAGTEEQVDWFLPIKPRDHAGRGGIVDIYEQMIREDLLPVGSLPFARDAGSNFYLLDRMTGRVWFMPMDEWDQEETSEQNWNRSGRTLASSLETFVHALTDDAPGWARD